MTLAEKRLLVEEVRRRRRTDDHERYVETFRRSAIDPNPHQVDATMFALGRLPYGGALLCDEVGLGKTIEAGLVVSQLRAEGRTHVLVIVPLALARQWQVELQDLFSIPATVVGAGNLQDLAAHGVFIVGREFAGSPRAVHVLQAAGPWDVAVIDEAHELFSGVFARYSKKTGHYDRTLSRGPARRAAQVMALLADTPILLLTATPLQNNLFELWGLVQYVDRSGTVLGPFNEFCELFVRGDGGRQVAEGMEETLRERLKGVVIRCLREQAQPFMEHPFTRRHVHTVNFSLRDAEKALYDSVSRWLSQEKLGAYRQSGRKLMALQLRRRMASSVDALAASLTNLRERMQKLLDDPSIPFYTPDELGLEGDAETVPGYDRELLESDLLEVARLEATAWDATRVEDQKKRQLLDLVVRLGRHAVTGAVADKMVVFTESVRTLETLSEFLAANGLQGDITLFSGTNDRPEARRALQAWDAEVGQFLAHRPDPAAAVRGALVHEFKTRTRIFIATEAGAKGLNLQFCNVLVNYDLPWNPQRIEQRIGRVHRYGQKHDVLIFNFINLDNAAEERVHHLLVEKLEVFPGLFGASDDILGLLAARLDFEQHINDVLDRCATPEAVRDAFDRLELDLDAAARQARDERLVRTRSLLSRLDATVQARLRRLDEDLQPALSRRDELLMKVLGCELVSIDGPRTVVSWQGRRYHLGPPAPGPDCGEPLDMGHPLVLEAFESIVAASQDRDLPGPADWEVYSLELRGLETEDRLVLVGSQAHPEWPVFPSLLEAQETLRGEVERWQGQRVERLLTQLRARREDAELYVGQQGKDLQNRIEKSARLCGSAATGAESDRARQEHHRLTLALQKFRTEAQAGLLETRRRLHEEEVHVRQQRFVSVAAKKLFSIRREV